MDGSVADYSDSDSGDSWILLEQDTAPAQGDEAPKFPEFENNEGCLEENNDKDEDTDGVSVISDSDIELATSCKIYPNIFRAQECFSPNDTNKITDDSQPCYNEEPLKDDNGFLGDNNKHKTYVHKRNKRLSTVLNIIMLGSVITAAGVAIGHMWGVRDDCSVHTSTSVNKLLSNLYKLQEENAYLRSIIKELTLANTAQLQKLETEKWSYKQPRCKKTFEESLTNQNVNKLTKCVDNQIHKSGNNYEKPSSIDANKLKNLYKQSRSHLDAEISKKIKIPEEFISRINDVQRKLNKNNKIQKISGQKSHDPLNSEEKPTKIANGEIRETLQINSVKDDHIKSLLEKKIGNVDSLEIDNGINNIRGNLKTETNNMPEKNREEHIVDNVLKDHDNFSVYSYNEDELLKDNRYIERKNKLDRKKQNGQKKLKKQKRKNKYEQWEMKGGYLKDYDDLSIISSQDNIQSDVNKNLPIQNIDHDSVVKNFKTDVDSLVGQDMEQKAVTKFNEANDANKILDNQNSWYDQRATLRKNARKKISESMFGENYINDAKWYFRRMKRREQCRTKGDNTTYKKFPKRSMNFKTKH